MQSEVSISLPILEISSRRQMINLLKYVIVTFDLFIYGMNGLQTRFLRVYEIINVCRFGNCPLGSSNAPWSVTAIGSEAQGSAPHQTWLHLAETIKLLSYGMYRHINAFIPFMTTQSKNLNHYYFLILTSNIDWGISALFFFSAVS